MPASSHPRRSLRLLHDRNNYHRPKSPSDLYLGDDRVSPILAELDRRNAVVLLYPTSRVGYERWSNGWKAALNALKITFDGPLSAGRKWNHKIELHRVLIDPD
jgi:hypothetical protein